MERVPVPTNAGRLINAVARIGYDPEVALTDLIDNSIDAGSHNINVVLVPNHTDDNGNTVTKYIIADDGCGMNR